MVIVDSSVLIPLARIGKLFLLKDFFKNIFITSNVYDEVKEGIGASEIEKGIKNWIHIKNIDGKSAKELANQEGIAIGDASLIILAGKNKDKLLSNDHGLIMVARSKNIECWWLTTFLLNCLRKKTLKKEEAKKILSELIGAGMRLDNLVYSAILKNIDDF